MKDANHYPMAEAVRAAYRSGQEDGALEPLVRVDDTSQPVGRIGEGDYVIFYDIRGEREIELTSAFVTSDFPHFSRQPIKVHFVTMIEYARSLSVRVAFPPVREIRHTMGGVVSAHGLRQVKIAESEKAIHVRYFLNGKREKCFPGETYVVIPSPQVRDYAEVPQMNAKAVSEAAIEAMDDQQAAFIVVNFCNVDVIGHIEDRPAILQAVTEVDRRIGKVFEAARARGITVVVTADHGTVERWLYPEGAIDTGHTDSPVPFTIVDPELQGAALRRGGVLTDVAPTVLHLLGLPQPAEMTGANLLTNGESKPRRVLMVIADGWGSRNDPEGNLILEAETPVMDGLQQAWPTTRLQAAGEAVGMPAGTVGNSEAGHLHIGAGRRILSDRMRIDKAIANGSFFANEAFRWAMQGAKRDGTRLHLLGIVSFYSSHGSVNHLKALLEMTSREKVPEVYVHAMLGRRGERPESGAHYIEDVERETERLRTGLVASVVGRFWSLDREENWDRIEKTYRWLVEGRGQGVPASERDG
ncbi:MAG: alkaline phosphatase family protein [Desulfobacterales bacterium]|nr:alkaline phosphatase family protein [Desulfobacterales bacterium]